MNTWTYKNKEFDSEAAIEEGYIGFVYLVTNTTDGKMYVGKKLLISKRKMPALKGKNGRTRRRRTKIVETNWRDYYGSSEEVKRLVEETGAENFKREVLHLCRTKGELSYKETKEQLERDVLLHPDKYYNGYVGCKIHRLHVNHLIQE